MYKKPLSIESFSPNCLMGTVGAVAKYKFAIPNINKLYFNHSYCYITSGGQVDFLQDSHFLNINLSRELPINKNFFVKRLKEYYGLDLSYKGYHSFNELINDVTYFTSIGEPLLTEIDFFYLKGHYFYHKTHDQHMMIIYGVDLKQKCLKVSEAIFGHMDFSLEDYQAFFEEVSNKIQRPFYLMLVNSSLVTNNKINLQYLSYDLKLSLNNLNHEQHGKAALKSFIEDLDCFYQTNSTTLKKTFYITGIWVFMCNSMNNFKFMQELEIDYPSLNKHLITEIKKLMTQLNRKWFCVTMDIENSISKLDFSVTKNIMPTLNEILNLEKTSYPLLEQFVFTLEEVYANEETLS
jgi:hypothetical protein